MSNQPTSNDTLRVVVIVLALLLLAPMLLMAVMFPMMGMWGGGMMGGFGGMDGVSPLWGVAMSLVWLVVLAGGGYLVYRWATGSGGAGTDPALEELRLAYARGDVTEEEYETRRERLGGE